jgi:hypothetical protein
MQGLCTLLCICPCQVLHCSFSAQRLCCCADMSLLCVQKRTLYFAPIGKVMAPVAGTAWNASRSAAQRAGQLPSAVLALHRCLRSKDEGHAIPVQCQDSCFHVNVRTWP